MWDWSSFMCNSIDGSWLRWRPMAELVFVFNGRLRCLCGASLVFGGVVRKTHPPLSLAARRSSSVLLLLVCEFEVICRVLIYKNRKYNTNTIQWSGDERQTKRQRTAKKKANEAENDAANEWRRAVIGIKAYKQACAYTYHNFGSVWNSDYFRAWSGLLFAAGKPE